jgi:hypothetical protein
MNSWSEIGFNMSDDDEKARQIVPTKIVDNSFRAWNILNKCCGLHNRSKENFS